MDLFPKSSFKDVVFLNEGEGWGEAEDIEGLRK